MKNFQKMLPVAAVLISLSPLAAKAVTFGAGSHPTISHSLNAESQSLAENSEGRATDHYAVNSKGRPGEFARPTTEQAAYTPQYSFSAATPQNANDAPIPNGN